MEIIKKNSAGDNCSAMRNPINNGARQKMQRQLTAIIEREGDGYVSLCPELDIASQGETIEEARHNLQEALELFFEAASGEEMKDRLREEIYINQVEVAVG
jgi:predicted RNase H-like HicB family nuclease